MNSTSYARTFTRNALPAALLCVTLLAFCSAASAQSVGEQPSTSSKLTPGGLQAGSPAGSYPLSGFDNVNLFNGNLNVRLPLLKVGGRGEAGYTMTLAANTKTWQVNFQPGNDTSQQGGGSPGQIPDKYIPQWGRWNDLSAGYGPGVMQGRSTGVGTVLRKSTDTGQVICNRTTPMYTHTLTRLTFVTPDGAEYELRDEATGGKPMPVPQERCNDASMFGAARGRRFVSADGTSTVFVSDADVYDYINVNPAGVWVFSPSGTLYTRDGARYVIQQGLVRAIEDRNGNQVTFDYAPVQNHAGVYVSLSTDSLGRTITIKYDQTDTTYGLHDQITYSGFGGTARVIRVSKKNLDSVLRPDFSLQLYADLFPELNGALGIINSATGDRHFNPQVISAVWLPDGRGYKFYYDSYGEVARVELPTGGAYEYDFTSGSGVIVSAGATDAGSEERQIYRRLTSRRAYTGLAANTLVATDRYTTGDGVLESDSDVKVEQSDKDGHLLALSVHHFQGSAAQSLFTRVAGSLYSPEGEGKEYLTELLDTVSQRTVLRSVTNTWEQREPVAWVGHIDYWGSNFVPPGLSIEPDNDPRLTKVVTKLETGEASQQVLSYDRFNNRTDLYEYDFGAANGAAGPLARHTHTDYANSANLINNLDYTGPDIYLVSLPVAQWVSSDAAGNGKQSLTTFEYDKYADDGIHAPLKDWAAVTGLPVSGHDPAYSAGRTTRGNGTGVTRYADAFHGAGGVTSATQYDIAGSVVKAIGPRGVLDPRHYGTTFDYTDRFGSPDGDARQNSAPAELSAQMSYAFPTSVTNALGQTAYTQFDYYLGLPVDGEDANGIVTSAEYGNNDLDKLDRPSRLISAANVSDPNAAVRSQTLFVYDDDGHTITMKSDLTTFNDPHPLTHQSIYDGLGRTVESRQYEDDAQYIATLTVYDGLGRVSKVSNPYRPQAAESLLWTTMTYDPLARVIDVATPDGAHVQTGYDGARVLVTDQAGKQRLSRTDALGRLTDVWEVRSADAASGTESLSFPHHDGVPDVSAGYRTSYTFDAQGNLCKVEQGAQRRYFSYDSLSRLVRAKTPEQDARAELALPAGQTSPLSDNNNAWSLSYDYYADGSVQARTDARLVAINYSYDELGRLKTRSYTDATPSVVYTYDDPSVVNSAGLLTKVSSSVSETAYLEFDATGRVRRTTQTTDGRSYPISYDYFLSGSPKSETYPSGRVVSSQYDGAGRLQAVSGMTGTDPSTLKSYAADIAYASHGLVVAMRLGNGLWEHTAFNSRLQPTQIGLGTTVADASRLRLDYGYGAGDNNGNVRAQTITAGQLTLQQIYEYDELNRLRSAAESGGAAQVWQQVYKYDRYGNRVLDSGTSTPALPQGGGEDPVLNPQVSTLSNRVTSSGYSFDQAGDLNAAPGYSYTYDGEGRMVSADGGSPLGPSSYAYDGDGKRVKKTTGGSITVFVHDASGRLIAEYASAPPAGDGTQYLTEDNLGTPRVVTDARGAVVSRHDYLPFGAEIGAGVGGRTAAQGYSGTDNIRQKWHTLERDDETGLDYAQARYYASAQGRFTSVDPLMLSSRTSDPQTWNRYSYGYNNPLRFTDPNGMCAADFYNQDGKRLGTDGIDDGKIYVVPDKEQAKQIEQTDKNGETTQASAVSSAVELPSPTVRAAIGAAVERSNSPTADDTKGGFHEEGLIAGPALAGGQETVVNAAPGPYSDPRVPGTATIDTTNPANPAQAGTLADITVMAHVHPGGEITSTSGPNSGGGTTVFGGTVTTTTANFNQPPSSADIQNAATRSNSVTNIVAGARSKTVYIYNGGGVRATFPLSRFLSVGRR